MLVVSRKRNDQFYRFRKIVMLYLYSYESCIIRGLNQWIYNISAILNYCQTITFIVHGITISSKILNRKANYNIKPHVITVLSHSELIDRIVIA